MFPIFHNPNWRTPLADKANLINYMYVPIVFTWFAYYLVYTSETLLFNLFGWIYHIWPCFYHIVLIMIAWNII